MTKLFLGRYAQNLTKSISIIVSLARLARQESYKPDGVFQRSEVFPCARLLNVVKDGLNGGFHLEARLQGEASMQDIKATAQPFTRGFYGFCF